MNSVWIEGGRPLGRGPFVSRTATARGSWLALVLSACGNGSSPLVSSGTQPDPVSVVPAQPTNASVTPTGIAVSAEAASGSETDVGPCSPEGDTLAATVFHDNLVTDAGWPLLMSRTLYSWTTEEQAAELQAGLPLLNRTERPGLGPGAAIEYLRDAHQSESEEEVALIGLLTSEEYSRARYAWPHAWATRMGWPAVNGEPAESYGNQLIQLILKPEARWVVVAQGVLFVVDVEGSRVTLADALAEPERIAGMYYQNDRVGETQCGTFGQSSNGGYREYVVMNHGMIESWSLGAQQVREVVRSDIEKLKRFFDIIRQCPIGSSVAEWVGQVVCGGWWGSDSEIGAYERALALVNGNYLPRPAEIASLVDTLESDLKQWSIETTSEDTKSESAVYDAAVSDVAVLGVVDAGGL